MLTYIALGVLAFVALLLVVIATRPADFRIERHTTIAAPAGVVFGFLADFRQWAKWSPWERLDPAMQKTYEGSGVGSTYHWVGNKKVGEGRMTLTEAVEPERVALKLEFIKPWTATNKTEFVLGPQAGGTSVIWTMNGQNNFMSKAFSLFVNMDTMIGKDFEKGLAELKRLSERQGNA